MIVELKSYLEYIGNGHSDELFNGDHLTLNNTYAIRVVYSGKDIWYEVDQEPLMEGCYVYATNDFKDCLNWCNEHLGTNILYY